MSILKRVTYHNKKSETPQPKSPVFKEKIVNLVQAVPGLVKSGFQTVSEEEENLRLEICTTKCPGNYWNPEGNLGLGECRHPKCGCSRYKHKFAASKCPDGLW